MVEYKEHKLKYGGVYPIYEIDLVDVPVTIKQMKEIAKPRGRETVEQYVDTHCFQVEDLEVVGNIHDNPELLKESEE